MRHALIVLVSLLPMAALAQQVSQQELETLDQRCEAAREAALAPIRKRMAQECERTRERSPDPHQECEAEMQTYGNNRTGAKGNVVRGLFYDLPECLQAQEAWAKWERTQPWK